MLDREKASVDKEYGARERERDEIRRLIARARTHKVLRVKRKNLDSNGIGSIKSDSNRTNFSCI